MRRRRPGQLPLLYVVGSDTSLAAAVSQEPSRGTKRARVLECVRRREPYGMTCDELEVLLGWPHQSVSARLYELVALGLLEDSGRRRLTRALRLARVLIAVPLRGP